MTFAFCARRAAPARGRLAAEPRIHTARRDRIDATCRLAVRLNTRTLGAASLGLLSPILTSVLHNGSTIAILLKALRRSSARA